MTRRPSPRFLYALLVVLIAAQGAWWVIYQSREGRRHETAELARLEAERERAELVLRLLPESREDLAAQLRADFPDLLFDAGAAPPVRIDPRAIEAAHEEARRRTRMFRFEGAFFLALLAAGTIVLGVAQRSESRFRRAREAFLAGVTHEFRTPLAALRLQAETLARSDLPDAARAAILPKLAGEVDRMEALVDRVLEAGRGDRLDPRTFETLDAGEESRRVLEEVEATLRREGAHVDATLPRGHRFDGKPHAFATALRNLLQNAAKYSAPPARITLEVNGDERTVRVAVGDAGPGIAREDRARIFESFTRGERADRARTRGAGLGLYLAKRSVEAMGGRIALSSEPGCGSTFTIVLPRSTSAAPGAAPGAEPRGAPGAATAAAPREPA